MSEATRVRRALLVRGGDPEALRVRLAALDGVEAVESAGAAPKVVYDVTRVDYATLVSAAGEAGATPSPGWLAALRRAWYGYLDGNLRASAGAKAGPCCSNPTEIMAQRKRSR